MKKFISVTILLSFLLIQMHGFFHSDIVHHSNKHDCTICEVVSHSPSLVPLTLDIDVSPSVLPDILLHFSEKMFVPRLATLGSRGPRAPPVI